MRFPPSEQEEHALIAIYARPSAAEGSSSPSGPATESSGGNGGIGGGGGGGDLEGAAVGAVAGFTDGKKGKGNSVEDGITEKREWGRESNTTTRRYVGARRAGSCCFCFCLPHSFSTDK